MIELGRRHKRPEWVAIGQFARRDDQVERPHVHRELSRLGGRAGGLDLVGRGPEQLIQ